jgi:hypothetical protein
LVSRTSHPIPTERYLLEKDASDANA